MITSTTHDIGAAMRREDEVHRHVGKITSRMAGVDECLSLILARAVAPEDPSLAVSIFRDAFFTTKLQYLKKALPHAWTWRGPLLKWTKNIEDYRNTLAHSSVHTAFDLATPTAQTLLIKKGNIEEVISSDFDLWESRADVLYGVMVMVSRAPETEFLQNDLRQLGTQFAGDRAQYRIAVDDLFPAAE